ncbi:hypothetical protein Plim_0912 [Planctopirus limnophila DSM 3776]|uniref:Secreted protein n=1 Tax=Planctopirus limnophila (strain ATCC 43296 / DSM 3776 / IFAM 1008 / Mu 290) TaxID=521674 RepID=D5SSK8_PLAL2|nr:hypothetical protein [Planctopirus limnophila]ADG66756.1 hypothetical protein Plim_0912 [Planctopirus limnophila DSM 3776]
MQTPRWSRIVAALILTVLASHSANIIADEIKTPQEQAPSPRLKKNTAQPAKPKTGQSVTGGFSSGNASAFGTASASGGAFASGGASGSGSTSGSGGSSGTGNNSGSGAPSSGQGSGTSSSQGFTQSSSSGSVTLEISDGTPGKNNTTTEKKNTTRTGQPIAKQPANGEIRSGQVIVQSGKVTLKKSDSDDTSNSETQTYTVIAEPAGDDTTEVVVSVADDGQGSFKVTTTKDGNILILKPSTEVPVEGQRTGMRIAGPVFVTTTSQHLPENMTVNYTKTGKDEGKIKVTRGDSTWDVSESEISTLPPEVQAQVRTLFGRLSGPHAMPLPPMPSMGFMPVPQGQFTEATQEARQQAEKAMNDARRQYEQAVKEQREKMDRIIKEQQQRSGQPNMAPAAPGVPGAPRLQTAPLARMERLSFPQAEPSADIQAIKAQQESLRKEVEALRLSIEALVKASQPQPPKTEAENK